MRKRTNCFVMAVLVLLLINGCNKSEVNEHDLFQFKNSYVGDNGAVGNIAMQLSGSEYLTGFELQTKEEPYGIILNYEEIVDEINYKETAIFNGTYMFALVQNADFVVFNFDGQEYEVTRVDLESWYGEELKDYTNEEELTELTQKFLIDENKVNQFFEK